MSWDRWGSRVCRRLRLIEYGEFLLLRTDVADEVCIHDFSVWRYLNLFDEKYGTCAFYPFGDRTGGADAVGEKAAEFI